jgi:sialate O-acetylesterase
MHLFAKGDKLVLLNLTGSWKFSIGDNLEWALPDFDDSSWESIKVPSAWEDQGFYGYDGYGWYRTSFTTTREMKSKELFLIFGYISDVDQVFINGKLIGFSGTFPPDFSSAHEAKRKYPIPEEYLNFTGKNVIAVRVYNHQMEGGIISGEVGIVTFGNAKPDVSIAGLWSFNIGDNQTWKDSGYQDKHWKKIMVPGTLVSQGIKEYNGVAWYRKHVMIQKDYENQKMILVLGNISDEDKVYINGVLVNLNEDVLHISGKDKNKHPGDVPQNSSRYYMIPKNVLKGNKPNLIAVKIINNKLKGGLMDGPVGIVKALNLARYQKELANDEPDN